MAILRGQFSTARNVTTGEYVEFGIRSVFTRTYLNSSGPVYLTFNGTCNGTSGGYPLTSGDNFYLNDGFPISGIGLMATTTAMTVNILALGG